MTELDIEAWDRKEHFKFFKDFEEPFFGVVVDVDCTLAYEYCKSKGVSFFLYYLHKSLKAANLVEPFRYRILGDKVVVYKQINAAPTTLRSNGTFGFSYMDYYEDFYEFEKHAKLEIQRVQESSGLNPSSSSDNVIHFSALPWIKFTSFSHARRFAALDSCPKISFGKMTEKNGIKEMPVSIHVHHALMDGYHVGKFIDCLQNLLNETSEVIL
jgi:chloramphenicol O-acetyltransferase type A